MCLPDSGHGAHYDCKVITFFRITAFFATLFNSYSTMYDAREHRHTATPASRRRPCVQRRGAEFSLQRHVLHGTAGRFTQQRRPFGIGGEAVSQHVGARFATQGEAYGQLAGFQLVGNTNMGGAKAVAYFYKINAALKPWPSPAVPQNARHPPAHLVRRVCQSRPTSLRQRCNSAAVSRGRALVPPRCTVPAMRKPL